MLRENEAELEYDLRKELRISGIKELNELNFIARYGILKGLASDPGTLLGAKLNGLERPASFEEIVLWDIADINIMANSDPKKKVNRYPRPIKASVNNSQIDEEVAKSHIEILKKARRRS